MIDDRPAQTESALLKVIFRQQKTIARMAAEAEQLREKLAASERFGEMRARRSRELLDNLLKVEFEARVAKGCYSSCPVGRIAK